MGVGFVIPQRVWRQDIKAQPSAAVLLIAAGADQRVSVAYPICGTVNVISGGLVSACFRPVFADFVGRRGHTIGG